MTENVYDTIISEIWRVTLNLYKETFESFGEDLGKTENQMDYFNYLKSDPIELAKKGTDPYNNDPDDPSDRRITQDKFVDYNGPVDGSIGSSAFPQGKGKSMDPKGTYYPFYTFGFGASPKARPGKAKSARSGVDCCKLAIDTIMSYKDKGCKTIGDVICMYHTGKPTYDSFINHYNSISGIRDIADGRFVSSAEMINRQNKYQQHLVDYVHMSNKTPITRTKDVLFPLITFISRQEQGVNCEEACRIALEEMNIK